MFPFLVLLCNFVLDRQGGGLSIFGNSIPSTHHPTLSPYHHDSKGGERNGDQFIHTDFCVLLQPLESQMDIDYCGNFLSSYQNNTSLSNNHRCPNNKSVSTHFLHLNLLVINECIFFWVDTLSSQQTIGG